MSGVIRNQVVRLCLDAIEELRTHPAALTPREVSGVALLASLFDRPELAASVVRVAWKEPVKTSG
jgi:hypothetical protein